MTFHYTHYKVRLNKIEVIIIFRQHAIIYYVLFRIKIKE